MKEYLVKNKISLSSDVKVKILCIKEVCRTKFDISSYDESNSGMHIADATRRLFDSYVNWLYEQEARKILMRNRFVDIDSELRLYKNLNDAMSDVYDIVVLGTCGPEGWWGPAQIHDIAIDFHRCLWQAIIGARLEKKRELDVPLDLFPDFITFLRHHIAQIGNQ